MNTLHFFSLALLFALSLGACREEYPADCAGYSAAIYKSGCAYAEGSYENFGDYAIFGRNRVADTLNGGWKHDNRLKSIFMTNIYGICAEHIHIGIKNLILSNRDTVPLKFSRFGLARDFPTASMVYLDADATIEDYHLVDNTESWVIIDKVNTDSTLIEGRFQVSFVTTIEELISGELERWDAPNRPDTLHFRYGRFEAEFVCF